MHPLRRIATQQAPFRRNLCQLLRLTDAELSTTVTVCSDGP